PGEWNALWFLANGATVAYIEVQGITIEVLNGLVSAGLATKIVETPGRGTTAVEITRGWEITLAGSEALRGTMKRDALFKITVDGRPRRAIAAIPRLPPWGAIFLKTKNPASVVIVRDVVA